MTPRLRHLARVNPSTPEFDRLEDDAEVTFIPLEAVWPGDRFDVTRRRPKAEVAVGYTRFREGDILVPKITPTFQADRTVIAHGLDGCVGAGTTELHIVRTGESADARYLRYLLSSKPFLDEGEASMIGVAGQKRVPDDCLRDLRVSVATLDWQRAIANYLDVETARIDALIEKKRRMVELLHDELTSTVEDIIWSRAISTMPLKYRTDQNRPIMYGIVLPGPNVSDGVPIVKGGDVAARRLSPGPVNRTTRDIEAPYARARLAADDLVFAIRGSVGEVKIVPKELAGANITQDVARVSTARDVLPEWLYYVLRSMPVQRQASERTTGATIRGLNIWELKRIRVPTSDLVRQKSDLDALQPVRRRIEQMRATLDRQVSLLIEHRQALITAAVTGELPIPGMAP